MSNSNSWVFDIETSIFSRIKHEGEKRLKGEYPNIHFTTSDKPTDTTVKYPTVYLHELPFTELGSDLEGNAINGVLYSMQVDVYTNTSQKDAKKVMAEIALLFKQLRFEITSSPENLNTNTVYRQVMRVRRHIGANDVI